MAKRISCANERQLSRQTKRIIGYLFRLPLFPFISSVFAHYFGHTQPMPSVSPSHFSYFASDLNNLRSMHSQTCQANSELSPNGLASRRRTIRVYKKIKKRVQVSNRKIIAQEGDNNFVHSKEVCQ